VIERGPAVVGGAREFDLLVVGEINPDLVLRGGDLAPAFGQREKLVEDASLTLGSSSVITACGAARLGLRTAFVGLVGNDAFGRFMLGAMADRGIDTRGCLIDRTLSTGVSVVLSSPGDRAILTHLGATAELRGEQVDRSLLARARHLHVGGYFLQRRLQAGLPALFRDARGAGASTSLDTNWDPSGAWTGLDEALAACDVLLPNQAEALALARRDTLCAAVEALAGLVPTVAAKLGAEGGLARRGSEEARVPGVPVEVVDTTGAGDSFDAGFLYGWLNGWPLERSLRLASACGSLSTRCAGGTDGQPTLAEALEAVDGASTSP
jgi:sugar/nucleoside kinase (ribokinase family)